MTTETEKAESLLRFDERRKEWAKASNLSDGERDLVLETYLMGRIGYLKSEGIELRKRAMTPTQKNAKGSLKEKLVAGLNDLNLSAGYLFGPMQQRIRFYQKDLRAIFDAEKIGGIVHECAMNLGRDKEGNDLGREFAFVILDALKDAFPNDDILIVRGLKPLFGLDEPHRGFSGQERGKPVRKRRVAVQKRT